MGKIKLNITNNIADTLFITLYAKAVETEKKNPLITDRKACELVEKFNYDFSKYKKGKASSVGVAIRASHFDEMIKQFIDRHENPLVVLIGCGLDTRKQRVGNIADKAIFYQLDIEEVINVRKQLLPPDKNENYIASSMFNIAWMDDLISKHPTGNFIFIIEGVLMYFNEADNKFVFTELAKRFDGAELHFDLLNRWLSKRSSMHDTIRKTNAAFKFGLNDPKEIEQWHPQLKFQRTWLFNEFKGWRRMGFVLSTLMSFIPVMRTSTRLVAYRIGVE